MLYNDSKAIYIMWDYSTRTNVRFYRIYRADYINGEYAVIDTIDYPKNDYYDPDGTPFMFYKVEELDEDENSLSMMGPFVGEEALVRASLYYQIRDLLELQVADEVAIFDRTRTKANFQFHNWNYWNPVEVRITSPNEEDGGYQGLSTDTPVYKTAELDSGENNYENGLVIKPNYQGTVYFNEFTTGNPYSVHGYDEVQASYQVRMFTVREMNDALSLALSAITALPGTPKVQSVSAAPFMWDAALISGAGYFLMRNLATRILNKQTRKLLLDNNIEASYIKGLSENLRDDFEKYKETLPYATYPRIFSVVSPTHTMPGGRSRMYRQIWHSGLG